MARIAPNQWQRWVLRSEVNPRYLRIPDAVRYCGLPRAEVGRLCATRDFESFCYKLDPAVANGIRLIVVSSIDRYMDKIAREQMTWMIVKDDPQKMEGPMAPAKARVIEPQEALSR